MAQTPNAVQEVRLEITVLRHWTVPVRSKAQIDELLREVEAILTKACGPGCSVHLIQNKGETEGDNIGVMGALDAATARTEWDARKLGDHPDFAEIFKNAEETGDFPAAAILPLDRKSVV